MNALADWDDQPADRRDAMLAMLRAEVAAAHDAMRSLGMTYAMRGPTVVVVSAKRVGAELEVTWYGHFRVGHYAQSGSDWNEHEVVVKKTRFAADGAIASAEVLGRRSFNVPERDEGDYDDDGEAQAAASAIMKV